MPVRIKRTNIVADPSVPEGPEFVEQAFEDRVTVVDGQEFHWAHNQTRALPDDGVADAHVAFNAGATIIVDSAPGEGRS